MIIQIDVDPTWVETARALATDLGRLNNSIRKGEGNLIGFLGEEIVCQYYGMTRANTYNYDVMIDGHKIDVKTKETNTRPELHFNATVADYNTKQKCDSYYFVRVDSLLDRAWLLGGIQKDTFYQKATLCKQGEIDPTSPFGWTFKATCYNLVISELGNCLNTDETIFWP